MSDDTGKSVEDILIERGKNYGAFTDQAQLSQNLKALVRSHAKWHDVELTNYMWEAIEMTLHKIARACNGNPYEADHYRDIAGYNTLVVTALESAEKEESEICTLCGTILYPFEHEKGRCALCIEVFGKMGVPSEDLLTEVEEQRNGKPVVGTFVPSEDFYDGNEDGE